MKRLVLLVLRVGLGGLFILAGALKVGDPAAFATSIANYRLWPALAPYLAAALPATEIFCGLVLILAPSLWRRAAALAIGGLSIVFLIGAISALARGIDVACGCFGGAEESISSWTVVRDLGLIATAAILVRFDRAPANP